MKNSSFFVRLFFSASILLFAPMSASAQVTIGSSNPPSPWSLLDLDNPENTDRHRALHLPRLSYAQRDALINESSPPLRQDSAIGLMIFNVENQCLEFWNGSEWISRCVDATHPCCGTGGVATRMRIGKNFYYTHEFMINGVMRCWMVENSREGTPRYMELTGIPNFVSVWNQHGSQPVGARGFYYTWATAQTDACPPGWSVPTPQEFGRNSGEGLWATLEAMPNNNNADNPRRFWHTAPYARAGFRNSLGHWLQWDNWSYWWSSTSAQRFEANRHSAGSLEFSSGNLGGGASVRCIQDLE